MRIRGAVFVVALIVLLLAGFGGSPDLRAQTPATAASAKDAKAGMMAGGIPDLSGIWDPDFHGPEGVRLNTWDSSDPFAKNPEKAPMTPWAAAKFKDVRPPFGALQTFDNTNDPVQRYCDPPGRSAHLYVSLGDDIHPDAKDRVHPVRVHKGLAGGLHG